MKNYIFLCYMAICSVACSSGHHPIETSDAKIERICTLKENISLIKTPVSLSMVDDKSFVISDRNGVYLYDTEGNQKAQIGRTGRARSEYNMPSIARCCGDSVYIWCPMSLKLVTWSLDGQPGTEYDYKSAVSDFVPSDGDLFIYTAGLRMDNVVDIYDKSSRSVRRTLSESSDRHKMLLVLLSSYPMYMSGDDFYYMPKDEMVLMHYDMAKDKLSEVSRVESDTFVVDEDLSFDLMDGDKTEAFRKLHENSQVLFLCPGRKSFYVLTKEGAGKMPGDMNNYKTDYSDVAVSLYEIKKNSSRHIASYKYDSIGTLALFSHRNGSIYFIRHEVENGDDAYTLNKLS